MAEIKGLTITIGADTKQFNKELRAMDREIRNTEKTAQALEKSLQTEFSAEKLVMAQKYAQKAIDDTNTKTQALRDQLEHLEKTGGVDSDNYQKLQLELIKSEDKARILQQRLKDLDNLKLERLSKQFKDAGNAIEGVGKKLAPISAAAGAIVVGMGAIGKATINSADTLKTLADRVNLSAEELQKWQYVAMQTDVSNEELQAGLTKTQTAFGALSTGNMNVASKALVELGFSAEQASKGMAENFDLLVKKLSDIEDPMVQASYVTELFGEKMGSKLIPMLKAGGQGLEELSKEFSNFDTLTNEQIDGLADFDNVLNNLSYSFKTMKEQLGAALLPVMETFSEFMNNKIVPAVKSLVNWFKGLSDTQKNMTVGILTAVAAAAPLLIAIGSMTKGIGGLITGIKGVNSAFTLLSAHPIIAIIGVIIGLFALLYSSNEQFRNSINQLVGTLTSAFGPILGLVGKLLGNIVSALSPLIQMLGLALTPIINMLTDVLKFAMGILEGYINMWIKLFNVIVDGINFITGSNLKKLEEVKLTVDDNTYDSKKTNDTVNDIVEGTYQDNTVTQVPITNNDYSNKNITIEVVVQNYAEEVDVDNLVEQINIKLAEQM